MCYPQIYIIKNEFILLREQWKLPGEVTIQTLSRKFSLEKTLEFRSIGNARAGSIPAASTKIS